MANKEELEAIGIIVKQCKECCKDISEEEYNSHKGYCKSCYKDRYNIENAKRQFNKTDDNNTNYNEKNEKSTTNIVAKVIKIIAILNAIAGVILGLVGIEDFEVYAVVFIVASIISSIFIYAIGEIIQLLEDIKNK